ncbi:MAG: orotate phosphoribosyltransferase [Acidobacteriota bacterium]|nr:MAG: orotate phosphoribosyltransferase [Acidobacteriota bacterium]
MTTPVRQRLARILRELSLRRGEFVLASGKTSRYYLDCRQTTLHPEGAYLVGHLILDALARRGWSPGAIGGLTLGADPVAVAASVVSYLEERPIPAFLVRKKAKEHGTRRQIEGAPPAGTAVVLVEDVITTGGSTLQAAEACRAAELPILGAVGLVDREEGGREALAREGIALEALFTASELLAD